MKEIESLLKALESEIAKTPTGELRNLLCDLNIAVNFLTSPYRIDCSDLKPDFVKALHQLIETQR